MVDVDSSGPLWDASYLLPPENDVPSLFRVALTSFTDLKPLNMTNSLVWSDFTIGGETREAASAAVESEGEADMSVQARIAAHHDSEENAVEYDDIFNCYALNDLLHGGEEAEEDATEKRDNRDIGVVDVINNELKKIERKERKLIRAVMREQKRRRRGNEAHTARNGKKRKLNEDDEERRKVKKASGEDGNSEVLSEKCAKWGKKMAVVAVSLSDEGEFFRSKLFETHRILAPNLRIVGTQSKEDSSIQYECPSCRLILNDKRSIERHMLLHMEPHVCIVCGVEVESTEELTVLMRQAYCFPCATIVREKEAERVREYERTKNDRYKCNECSYATTIGADYLTHYQRHKNAAFPPLRCNVCFIDYFSETELKRHMARHEQAAFECCLCDTACPSIMRLRNHIHDKHGEKRFKCPDCRYSSARSTDVRRHQKMMHPKGSPSISVPRWKRPRAEFTTLMAD